MRALSIPQPWATLIAEGVKTLETRAWAPSQSETGKRIGIHASKTIVLNPKYMDPETWEEMIQRHGFRWYREIPRGAMVATALLWGLHQVTSIEKDEAYLKDAEFTVPVDPHGDFTPGRWLWLMKNIRPIEPPIPITGRQRLWKWNGGEEFEDRHRQELKPHQPRLMTL